MRSVWRRLVLVVLLMAGATAPARLAAAPMAAQESGGSGLSFDDDRLARIDSYLADTRQELGLPGLAAAIVAGDEIVYSKGFGEVSSGGAPIQPDTAFIIASLSKSITALALMQTVDDGLVDLDAPVSDYLPEFVSPDSGVTVRDLMHHRSGLSQEAGVEALRGEEGASLEANVARIGSLLEAGAGFEYSNLNYDTIALIVERVTGVSFGEFVAARIFGPVGMVNSQVAPADTAAEGFAQGHYRWLLLGYRPLEAWRPPGVAGGGFMASSAEDLARLLTVHINGGEYAGRRIVSPESLEILHEPRPYTEGTPLGYGGGWSIEPPGTEGKPAAISGYTNLWHNGDWDGYWAVQLVTPEAGLGIVLLANGHDERDTTSLLFVASNVRSILAGEETFDIPKRFGDFLQVWGKHLLLAAVLVQIALAFVSVPILRRIRSHRARRREWMILGVATAIDVAAAAALIWLIPAQAPMNVTLSLPDYRILIVTMAIGVAWGGIRSGLTAWYRWPFGSKRT